MGRGGLYALLGLYIAATLGFYAAGVAELVYAGSHQVVHAPFHIAKDWRHIDHLEPEAKAAGLAEGDELESLDGAPYTGVDQFKADTRSYHPGETLSVGVRRPDGSLRRATIHVTPERPVVFTRGEWIRFGLLFWFPPLFCLLIGYWVALAKPQEPNAWLVLLLLSFPEVFFLPTHGLWTGAVFMFQEFWFEMLQVLDFAVLLLFGLYFPERSRIDVRLPWLKWLLSLILLAGLCAGLLTQYGQRFNAGWSSWAVPVDIWADRIVNTTILLCVAAFFLALTDKLRFASTPDARRRLRVLVTGSAVGIISVIVIFVLVPLLGYEPNQPGHYWLAYIGAVLFLIFPLTLAYVVVVQRAMDVRILVRLGTKYALARATLVALQLAIAAFILIRFILPVITKRQHQAVDLVISALVLAGLFRLFVVRNSLSNRLQRWLDRKFFREAYDAELVLSELSEQARKFTERGPLIETVMRRVSEVLHVDQIAVLLRGSEVFQLRQAVGLTISGPLLLHENSSTVQNLSRTNRPATLYRENPDQWFLQAGEDEKRTLNQMRAELLLGLPGRERLMGVMALGPKRSEEPYTPSDLRLLQSVGTQTGLALEISELAHSLANEAAQRERIHREIEIAREVQERLFPQQIPVIKGLSLAGACRPAQGVGGDYYDVIELDDGRLGLAIGDVSGKGISAALLMASLRASLRGMTLDGPRDLARMMQKVNRLVYEASTSNRYATFFFATYHPATRELRYVNAGHNPPLLVRGAGQDSGAVTRLEAGGLVVGLMRDVQYTEEGMTLKAGDLLLTYTDGISEAMTAGDEEWGEERMLAAASKVREGTATEVLGSIFAAADEFTAGAPQHDDMTLLVLKVEPGS
jgi:phosphoserine phosphatase RsbU/P